MNNVMAGIQVMGVVIDSWMVLGDIQQSPGDERFNLDAAWHQ